MGFFDQAVKRKLAGGTGFDSGGNGGGGGGQGGGWGGWGGGGEGWTDIPNPFDSGSGSHTDTGWGGGGGWDPVAWAKANGSGVFGGAFGDLLDHWGGIVGGNAKKVGGALNPQSGFSADIPDIQRINYRNNLESALDSGLNSGKGQSDLAAALQQQSLTGGPQAQIAQNMLRQQTDQNIAQNSGMLASQKGINPALAARMAGQNAGTMNQQAAGQTENLKLASMLGAQNQLGNVLAQQRQGDNAYLNSLLSGISAQNQAINQGSLGAQNINANIELQNLKGRQGMFGGLMNGIGGMMTQGGAGGLLGKLKGAFGASPPKGESDPNPQPSGGDSDYSGGGGVSPSYNFYYDGGFIPGKAAVPGDSPANDTKTVKASPGEIFIPRTASGSPEAAKSFIDELFKRQRKTSYADVLRARRGMQEFNCGGMAYADGGVVDFTDPFSNPQSDETTDTTGQRMSWKDISKARETLDQPTRENRGATGSWGTKDMLSADPEGAWAAPEERGKALEPIPVKEKEPVKDNLNLEYKTPVTEADKVRDGQTAAAVQPEMPGYAKTVAGIQGQMKAAEDQYKQAHRAYEDLQTKQNEALGEFKRGYKEIDDETARIRKDIETSKVDPNKYWSDMSTAGKIMSGIGVVLSGIGSGLTGQDNMAMKVINNGIDASIDAQKAELGKKENLLSKNMARYGNLQDAYNATRAQLYAVSQAQIQDAAAKFDSEDAKSKAMMLWGKLEQEKSQAQQSLALSKLRGQALPFDLANRMAPGQAVQMPDGSARIATTKEGADEIRKTQQAMTKLNALLDRMERFSKNEAGLTGTWSGTKADADAESMMAQARLYLKDIGKLGVLSKDDFEKVVDPMIGNPGSFMSSRAQAKLQQLRQFAKENADATYEANLQGYRPIQNESRTIPLQ